MLGTQLPHLPKTTTKKIYHFVFIYYSIFFFFFWFVFFIRVKYEKNISALFAFIYFYTLSYTNRQQQKQVVGILPIYTIHTLRRYIMGIFTYAQ